MELVLHIKGNFSESSAYRRLDGMAGYFTGIGMTRQYVGRNGFKASIALQADMMERAIEGLQLRFEHESRKTASDMVFTPSVEKADGCVTFVVNANRPS